ncbi:unannotated protein [freshwater metagenome]|uniref:Unannotated protein n=1 Tax=freshwater metagenome TaxID=449393 RepID=A0A6J7SLB1_9ZZZZ
MAGGVDEVEDVGDAVTSGVGQAHRLALDRDATLALDIHAVEILRAHSATVDDSGDLQHAIGQGGLPVVDVGDDAEVPDDRRIGRARLGGVRIGHGGLDVLKVVEAEGLIAPLVCEGPHHRPTARTFL